MMALVDSKLATALEQIYTDMTNTPMSAHDFAVKMAKAIDDQIKTAEVNVGIDVLISTTAPEGLPSTGKTVTKGMLS